MGQALYITQCPNTLEEMAFTKLPQEPITIDKRGRITIPPQFIEALGLPKGQKYPIWIEEYRNERGECKSLIIRK